jgi:valyl-tRNA synthetase
MGWPDENETLSKFYPTQVLCTAREIITLWVSRMVMMGQYCVGDIPYSDVYIHAMIQDGQGRKMSKSLGNGIDPLVAIDSHGADAMRFTLASMTTDTQDVRMPVAAIELPDGRTVNSSPKFDVGRNFCNKLWNASRFAMMNLEGTDPGAFDAAKMDTTDKWILSRLAKTIAATTKGLEEFKYKEPLETGTWNGPSRESMMVSRSRSRRMCWRLCWIRCCGCCIRLFRLLPRAFFRI